MIEKLSIKNFALFDNISLEFSNGLNILTGETGAGKSLVIDALMILLGDRASSDFIKSGETKSIIEGYFNVTDNLAVYQFADLYSFDLYDGELVLRREINIKGNSRCFFNDTPMQVAQLKELGEVLVDFHGQYDHQILLKKDNHLRVLDSFANNRNYVEKYQVKLTQLKNLNNHYNELSESQSTAQSNLDLFRREFEEITSINPKINEYEEVEAELNIAENFENLVGNSNLAFDLIYNSEDSAHTKIIQARKAISELAKFDKAFDVYLKEIDTASIAIEEVSKYLRTYRDSIDYNSSKINKLRERIVTLNSLRRKYGSIENAISRASYLENELSLIESFPEDINALASQILSKKKELGFIANELSETRKKTAVRFSEMIIESLNGMGLGGCKFDVSITQELSSSGLTVIWNNEEYRALKDGIDKIEFLISTNPGVSVAPLAEIASGGEISRVMLAIKSVIADAESMPILIFDEIDSGISGRIAQKVGLVMNNLAKNHQIIAITHLPQIAALGDSNISIFKSIKNDTTIIKAKSLNHEEKELEVAKLIAGDSITSSIIGTAKELINIKQN